MKKSIPLNDLGGKVVFEHVGDRKKLIIMEINDYFDPAADWGQQLSAIRMKYYKALSIDKGIDVKVM
jgi:hypothetical protein